MGLGVSKERTKDMIEIDDTNKYIPGVCNIGREELKRRKNGIYLSLTLLILIVLVIHFSHAANGWKLLVFIPVAYVVISWQQWYFKFCVRFGLSGVFNFGDIGKAFTVEQKEYYRKDRAKALKMIMVGVIIGMAVAIIYYLL